MKSTLTLLLCALAIAGVYAEVNRTQLLLVSRGIIEGISTVKGWGDVTACISNDEGITTGIAEAVGKFKLNDSTTHTPAAIALGQALQKLPAALKTCNSTIQIGQTLVQVIRSIASLEEYIKTVKSNLNTYQVDLLKGAYAASSEFTKGNLQNFGNKVGQAIAQVFLNGTSKVPPKPDANTTSVYLLIAQGLIEGVDSALKWNHVQPCIKSTNDTNANIASALQFFQSSDPNSLTLGFAAIGSALISIPASIEQCTGSYTSASNLARAIAAINDPTAYLSLVKNNFALNGVDIYDEVYTAIQSFNAGSYKAFGTNVGLATSKLFFENVAAAKKTQNFLE